MDNFNHQPRPVRFIEIWKYNDWTIKIYGISQHNLQPDIALLDTAKEIAPTVYPAPGKTGDRYGMGFMVVHEADMFHQIVFDWWERENELRHIVYKSPSSHPIHFANITSSGEAFCVWELTVLGFERDAWMKHVLNGATDFNAYLQQTLSTSV